MMRKMARMGDKNSILNKTVFILIGPKGSGKSHVGTVLKKYFGIPFLNVDQLGLENIPKSKSLGEDLIIEGFHLEEEKIAEILQTEDSVPWPWRTFFVTI